MNELPTDGAWVVCLVFCHQKALFEGFESVRVDAGHVGRDGNVVWHPRYILERAEIGDEACIWRHVRTGVTYVIAGPPPNVRTSKQLELYLRLCNRADLDPARADDYYATWRKRNRLDC